MTPSYKKEMLTNCWPRRAFEMECFLKVHIFGVLLESCIKPVPDRGQL